MPRTRSLAWSELKIGVLAIAAIVIAITLIFMVGGQGGFFWQRYHLKTRFADVHGLKQGAVVRLAGVEVGKVTTVEFSGVTVEVIIEVSKGMRNRITTASRASIGSLSLLGEPVIDLTPSNVGTPLDDWGYVPPGKGAGQLGDVAATATQGLEEATELLQEIRRGRGTVGRLFTDEALYRDLVHLVDAAGEVATALNAGHGTVGALIKDPAAYRSLEVSLRNLSEVTQRINAGEGSLGRLLNDQSFAQSLASATNSVDAIAGRMNRGEGTAGKLLTDVQLYNRLNAVTDRLDQITTALNQGQGTAGQLLRDKQLYENMNGAVGELRSLITDIRKDPKKYLNVRVSIF